MHSPFGLLNCNSWAEMGIEDSPKTVVVGILVCQLKPIAALSFLNV
ncbi:hypothetical protein [Patiriisocius sp. Uisw_017]